VTAVTTLTPSTLTIKDLPLDEDLNREAMAALHGGMTVGQAFQQEQAAARGDCFFTSKSMLCML